MSLQKEGWGTRVGLVLAMAGNAVGLGNFLRFPAQAVQNGGGAFIIPYLVSFILMGIPLLWIEWAIGRHGGKYGHHSTPGMLDVLGKSKWWKYVGVFGIFTNLTIAAYYTYTESWTLAYVWHSVTGAFSGKNAQEVSDFFNNYVGDTGSFFNFPVLALFFFLFTLAVNTWILSRGLAKGIEIASKIGMPMLILFAIFLAIRSLTLDAGEHGAVNDATLGLNFLWEPQFDSLSNPKVWLAAAGQIFFTLSVGMGSIHCYASYVKENEDIALNAASAGWMNEFVEVVLGGSIVVPIAAAYLGLEWIQNPGNVGLAMGFRVMPTLFENWGPMLAALAGISWFGLLFFAGITSSLAMGQPVLAFLEDEYKMERTRAARVWGVLILILGSWTVFFYGFGAHTEFDDWSGTFALVVFAMFEAIAFAYVFGIDKGWAEINRGADIKIPDIFKFVIKYITPIFLVAVFLGTLISPLNGNWNEAFSSLFRGDGWPLDGGSIIGKIFHVGVEDTRWFVDGAPTPVFVVDMTRTLLLVTFIVIAVVIRNAWKRKEQQVAS
ncbi:MAG: sodium-dependent transporter [Ignavibacteriales bacterium]|nr:sodium-dependent transporter [Ignavibacteriales bacterium]